MANKKEQPTTTIAIKPDMMYVKGSGQGGYDPKVERWRDKTGRICSYQTYYDGRYTPAERCGGLVPTEFPAPISRKLEGLERIWLEAKDLSDLLKPQKPQADPIPSTIRSAMRLSEYFARTEGDIWESIMVPLEIILKPAEVKSKDEGAQRKLREVFEKMDIDQILEDMMVVKAIYGNVFPVEIMAERDEAPEVWILDPKFVNCGRNMVPIKLAPQDGTWSDTAKAMLQKTITFQALGIDPNDQSALADGQEIPIPEEMCHPFRDKCPPWWRYAMPRLFRASRQITTRQLHEEMMRATVEGYRNQLWVFQPGTPEEPCNDVPILNYLKTLVAGMAGERTGHLVWRGDLSVDVYTPEALSEMLAEDRWLQLTLHIFRQLGMFLSVVSGETAGERQDPVLNAKILLERISHDKRKTERWLTGFIKRWVVKQESDALKKADFEIYIGPTVLEVEDLIKNRLIPLMAAGKLSIRTALEEAGYDYPTELARKEEEEEVAHLFAPQPTFAQTTVRQEPVEVQQRPLGRTPDAQNVQKLTASFFVEGQDSDFETYVNEALGRFENLVQNPSEDAVRSFISDLRAMNERWMPAFAQHGYQHAGGRASAAPQWYNQQIAFVNSHLPKFQTKLLDLVQAGENLAGLEWQVFLYPQEGRHLAYMIGQQQALAERGATGWRRILHPELSQEGPCEQCIYDSHMLHPISEAFFEYHPHGVCSQQGVAYYFGPTTAIELPVPKRLILPADIIQYLRKIGRAVENIVRRVAMLEVG